MSRTLCISFWLVFLGISAVACTAVPEDTATVVPTRVMVAVTDTAVSLSPTAINISETVSSPAPAPMCTPPACTENEVYFCPGDCPNGCGTVCATPTPLSESDQTTVPTDSEALADWLQSAWNQNIDPIEVRDTLLAAGWLQKNTDWYLADLNNDRQLEWIVLLQHHFDAPTAKNIWVVNQNGRIFQYYEQSQLTLESIASRYPWRISIINTVDVNGDGVAELIVNDESCGAHTCYSGYQIYSVRNGTFTNLVQGSSEKLALRITVSFSDVRFEDYDQNGITDMLVHSGGLGSVGAGIVRTYTEVWSWDGTSVTLTNTILDPTQYRHHILYEANDEFAAGNLDRAVALYEQVINDTSLITPPPHFMLADEASADDVIKQFAAFRMILIDLQEGRVEGADNRLAWLKNNYPETPITQAVKTVVSSWAGSDLLVLCTEITAALKTLEYPSGPIPDFVMLDLGYGNPTLKAVDVCPAAIEE